MQLPVYKDICTQSPAESECLAGLKTCIRDAFSTEIEWKIIEVIKKYLKKR
jgi:trans-2-enoyl-CoA reductase